jgi:ABC-type multidrug transport system fused ATPase/permease subunit
MAAAQRTPASARGHALNTLESLPAALRLLRELSDSTVRQRLAVALLLVVAVGLLAALGPLALKGMVDELAGAIAAASPGSPGAHLSMPAAALTLGAAYVLALGLGRVLGELRPMLTGAAEQRLHARLAQRLFGHLLALPLAFHLGRRAGGVSHSLYQATTGCQLIVVSLINGIVPVVVEIATVAAVLVHLDQPALVVTFIATALAYLIVFGLGTPPLQTRAQAVSEAGMNTHATLTDHLLHVETIKCFNGEAAAEQCFRTTSEELEAGWRRLHSQRARIGLAAAATFTISVVTSLTLAADAVATGTLSVGGFVLANVYMLQVVRPLEMLGAAARDITQALAFIRPALDLLAQVPETPSPAARPNPAPTAREPPRPDRVSVPSSLSKKRPPRVQFERVSFAYDTGRPVLDGLSLDIAAGQNMAIVGASGSGKSSMVRLLMRLYTPQQGLICIDGQPIQDMPAAQLRSLIGIVPQDTALFNASVLHNIGIGKPGAARDEIEAAARVAQIHDFITSLPAGYDTPVGERGLKLSGGERQRVAIARAVLRRPRLYVFDEATSMLDSHTEDRILQQLQEVSEGCTTITIAHRLSTVRHAQEIVVLQGGRIVERGQHDALQALGGVFAQLWRLQVQGPPH